MENELKVPTMAEKLFASRSNKPEVYFGSWCWCFDDRAKK